MDESTINIRIKILMFLISNTIIFLARKIPFFNWPCRLVVMGRPHIIKAMSLVMIRFQMSMSAPRLRRTSVPLLPVRKGRPRTDGQGGWRGE